MSGIKKLMAGFYNESDEAITVYDEAGEIVWANSLSEKINKESGNSIYKEIKSKGNRNGRFSSLYGGKYRYSVVDDKEYIIVQHNKESRLLELFEEKYVSDFVISLDSSVREAVTSISASCGILEETIGTSEDNTAKLCLDEIMKSCCTILKSAAMVTQLASAAGEKLPQTVYIDIGEYIRKFSENCENVLGRKIYTDNEKTCEHIIKADKLQLTYLMLLAVRKLITGKGDNSEIHINHSFEENKAVIEIYAEKFSDKENTDKAENYGYITSDEVIGILANRLEAEISFADKKICLEFSSVKDDGLLMLESDKKYFTEGYFSPYRIMLGDIESNS